MNTKQLSISPYLKNGIWKFNDPLTRLAAEKLLNGKDAFCDRVANGRTTFTVIYSLTKSPETNVTMELVETGVKPEIAEDPNERGCVYLAKEYSNLRCYFCSHLLKYFKTPPAFIYLQVA
jgi:hypothetical protein